MSVFYSPLRYPGGKTSLLKYLTNIINLNEPIKTYIEPYAGGAGAAFGLLLNNSVERIILNEYDKAIYKFWCASLYETENLLKKVKEIRINLKEWRKQKEIFNDFLLGKDISDLNIGFATFFLNRCNRSGILNAGPIGGKKQIGKWKIDARFNKNELINRIKKIAELKNKINVYNLDAIEFLEGQLPRLNIDPKKTLIYLDPPYCEKGSSLYRYYYGNNDHKKLQNFLKGFNNIKWILSYDDIPFIHNLYKGTNKNKITMNHFAYKAKVGKELIIVSDNLTLTEKQLSLINSNKL
ncbi:MAG: DNA adenine methylase [Promethearchaeota archaeon]